jgi:hypothetical protein
MTQTEGEDWERSIRDELREAAEIRDEQERAEKSIDILRLIEDRRGRMDTVKQSDWVRNFLDLPSLMQDPYYKPKPGSVDRYVDPITNQRILLRARSEADLEKSKKMNGGNSRPPRRRGSH